MIVHSLPFFLRRHWSIPRHMRALSGKMMLKETAMATAPEKAMVVIMGKVELCNSHLNAFDPFESNP